MSNRLDSTKSLPNSQGGATPFCARPGRGASPRRPLSPHTAVYPQIWAWRNWLLMRPLPQLSHAPDFFISCGACRSGHAGGVPLPANPSVGAALRAVRLPANPSVGAARHSRRSAWLATKREPRLRGGYLRAVRPTSRPHTT